MDGANRFGYVRNSPVVYSDPNGEACIADRPLDSNRAIRALIAPFEYPCHRQILFEDGREPSNLGLFDDDKVRPDTSSKTGQYQCVVKGLDDAQMRRAVEEAKKKHGTNWTRNYNCQDFVDKVFEEYVKIKSNESNP